MKYTLRLKKNSHSKNNLTFEQNLFFDEHVMRGGMRHINQLQLAVLSKPDRSNSLTSVNDMVPVLFWTIS